MNNSSLKMASLLFLGLMLIFILPCSRGFTDPRDVFAINGFYVNMGFPLLPGWRIGGDPCLEGWQGVECVNSNITAIILNGANLMGQLTESLGVFVSIITLDLSNNHISGTIPENLPVTLRRFFLSANNFTGPIPSSLSTLTLLTDMAVNDNLLEGDLPDVFQPLAGLVNLDISSNNLSGQLPPSMGNLSSLSTLHVQNNHLSGMLNVLQDLPLENLNIENNLFSGPIPPKLLTIPDFKKDGNPFNTTISPSPAPILPSPASASPPFPVVGAPVPSAGIIANSIPYGKSDRKKATMVVIYAAIAVASVIISVLMITICISKSRKKQKDEEIPVMHKGKGQEKMNVSMHNANLNMLSVGQKDKPEKQKEHEIDMARTNVIMMPPLAEKIIVEPIVPPEKIPSSASQNLNSQSISSFSVSFLQQYTHSFAEENLISKDKLTKVYLAEFPDGKLLTVTKLETANLKIPTDEFLELVLRTSLLRHPNILELVGYCMEYEQRLLVYNYFSTRTLHDILHSKDDFKKKLSWNARVDITLGAARALEYLHEGCRPPVIHQNFDSAKILLDDRCSVRVSQCGFASLILSNSMGQIHELPNYETPEVNDIGSYTDKSDVYSFGVVMLELLTGRKPYESSRPREQRYLVRWASSQLYDINALSRIVDPSIDGKLPMKSLSRFADIISRCVQQQPEFRPPMSEVVQDLTRMIEDARSMQT
ncbi:protein STRUBBELIG-RECEPTOR FAMILY 3-like isoform X2 [Asparagus officinalis]|nr:protein STRUBBELIG-RECEPTOR FAMILY 3-like isoform X2 [Asparagus officinalis]